MRATWVAGDSRRLEKVTRQLEVVEDRSTSVLATLGPGLQELLEGEGAVALGLRPNESGFELEFEHASGVARPGHLAGMLAAGRSAGPGLLLFDPALPHPRQRNEPLALPPLEEWVRGSSGALRALMAQLGVPRGHRSLTAQALCSDGIQQLGQRTGTGHLHQLRVLVCEDARLLACISVYRRLPFGAREVTLLRAVVPFLRARLHLEQELREGGFFRAAFAAALEEIPGAVFVVDAGGTQRHANAVGEQLLKQDPGRVAEQIRRAVAQPVSATAALRVLAPGLARYLVVLREVEPAEARVRRFAALWQLTRRQGDALRGVSAGKSNKVIASELGCRDRTVEVHVSQVLAKARVHSRAELLVKLWADR